MILFFYLRNEVTPSEYNMHNLLVQINTKRKKKHRKNIQKKFEGSAQLQVMTVYFRFMNFLFPKFHNLFRHRASMSITCVNIFYAYTTSRHFCTENRSTLASLGTWSRKKKKRYENIPSKDISSFYTNSILRIKNMCPRDDAPRSRL